MCFHSDLSVGTGGEFSFTSSLEENLERYEEAHEHLAQDNIWMSQSNFLSESNKSVLQLSKM